MRQTAIETLGSDSAKLSPCMATAQRMEGIQPTKDRFVSEQTGRSNRVIACQGHPYAAPKRKRDSPTYLEIITTPPAAQVVGVPSYPASCA